MNRNKRDTDPTAGLFLDHRLHEIVTWFKTLYAAPSGFPYYEIDGETGQPTGSRTLLCELGDYLPFMYLAGEREYTRNQLMLLQKRVQNDPLLFSEPQIRVRSGLRLKLPDPLRVDHIDSLDYTEVLYGLLELNDVMGERLPLDLAEEIGSEVTSCFYRKGVVYTWFLPGRQVRLPVTESILGMFIEIYADLHQATGKPFYRAVAESIAQFWLNTPYFRRWKIFPSIHFTYSWLAWLPRLRRSARRSELVKYNTAVACGLLRLSRLTGDGRWKDAIDVWLEGLYTRFGAPNGAFYHLADLGSMLRSRTRPILSTNFAIIELLCDLHHEFDELRYLERAIQAGEFWLELQSPSTGLFPDDAAGHRSYLDGNTDFIVAFTKLYELSGEDRFQQAARRALMGILKYHHCPFGYFRDVDNRTGTPVNTIIETRFVSLFMKVLLLIHNNWTVYGDQGFESFLKDR